MDGVDGTMKFYQFVMYLFGYKVIDVRWQWNTKKEITTYAEAMADLKET